MSPEAGRFQRMMKERAEGARPEMDQFVQLRELLAPHWRTGLSVLDVGCGMAHTLPSLRKIDPDVDYRGIELDERRVVIAHDLFPGVRVDRGNVENLTGVEPADVVLCYMLLLHLDGYEKALENLAGVCRERLLIRTLLAPEEYRIRRYRKDGLWFWYNMYDEERFCMKLGDLGFDDVTVIDSPMRREVSFVDEWKTWTLGERQIFGNLILPWKVVHAVKKGAVR